MAVDALRELFAAGDTRGVEFVFVSACSSRPAGEAFVKAGTLPSVSFDERRVRMC